MKKLCNKIWVVSYCGHEFLFGFCIVLFDPEREFIFCGFAVFIMDDLSFFFPYHLDHFSLVPFGL
jgi:hypothetical protein